jgi:hypothetical protein
MGDRIVATPKVVFNLILFLPFLYIKRLIILGRLKMGKKRNEINSKVCKVCSKEKPIKEFSSKGRGFYHSICKACVALSKREIFYHNSEWTKEDDLIIFDYTINKKGQTINNLSIILKKDLKSICARITTVLKIKMPMSIECKCKNCSKTIFIKPKEKTI